MTNNIWPTFRIATTSMVLCLTALASNAQNSVFGFELGKPLTLSECPFKVVAGSKMYDVIPRSTCVQDAGPLNGYKIPVRRIIFGRDEAPPIVKNWTAFPLEINGNLVGFHFLTPGAAAQELALSQLTQKYGQPTSTSNRLMQNAMGASFNSTSATWELTNLRVKFDGITTKIETGEVYIDLPEATALRKSWLQTADTSTRQL